MDRKEEKNLIDRLNSSINNQVPKTATAIFVNNKMKTNSNANRAKSDRLEVQPCVNECNKETANCCETPVLKFTFDDCDFLTTKFKFVNLQITFVLLQLSGEMEIKLCVHNLKK